MSAIDFATRAVSAGLSVLPVIIGDKVPSVSTWKLWQSKIMATEEIASYFRKSELGIICGDVSGGLECLDFEYPDVFDKWKALVIENGGEDALTSCYIQSTQGGGFHVVYRANDVGGSKKLAEKMVNGKLDCLIETRGEGGYFKCYPSKGYQAKNNHLLNLPTLSDDDHELFISSARFLTERVVEKVTGPMGPSKETDTPGGAFNAQESWDDILTGAGWTLVKRHGGESYWRRPDKRNGVSATVNFKGNDCLWVFSTNAYPFDEGKSYTKFGAYAFLFHGGDFNAAAKDLFRKGYGKAPDRVTQAQRTTSEPPKSALKMPSILSLGAVEATTPDFLWEPYIRMKAINLLDAKGGAGKTTFSLMLGAAGSIGRLPYGAEVEPFDTLYFGGEDDPGELRTLFNKIGGNPERFHVVSEPFRLDAVGLKFVKDAIKQTGAKLVVFDALKYYLAGLVFNQLDDMQVAPHLSNLKQLAWDTGVAILNIRHFRKNADLTRLDEAGQGNEQWRNSHRSQMVMLRHPDEMGMTVCLHKKSNLLTAEGDAFAFQIQRGQYVWVPKDLIDLGFLDEKPKKGGAKQEACNDWLRALLNAAGHEGEFLTVIRDKAERAGFKTPQLYEAQKFLEVVVKGGSSKVWCLPDPFGD